MTTSERIAKLRELEAKATDGPWVVDHRQHANMTAEDSFLIVAMRNDLTWLLDELERMRALIKKAEYARDVGDRGFTECPWCSDAPHKSDCPIRDIVGES